MKARFFSLLAMVLCLASCQKDVDGLDVNVGGDTATISVVLPENAITRAAAAETNSAWSGLANEADEELTVTLYIFDENGNPSQKPYTAPLAEGQLQANFEVRLVPERHYTFVAWAGQKSAENLFTLGDPDQNEWTITLSDWTAMNEQRDAFTGIYSTAKTGKKFTSSSDITLNLTRPFAKLRVVTTDMEWLNNTNITPAYAEVSYEVELPKTFNAYSEAIGTEVFTQKAHQTFEIKDYTKDAKGEMTLFTDYILVPASGIVKFTLDVFEDEACTKLIKSNAFTTDIPVKRNNLTTIKGNVLTEGNDIKVTIDEEFGNGTEWDPEDDKYDVEVFSGVYNTGIVLSKSGTYIFDDLKVNAAEAAVVVNEDVEAVIAIKGYAKLNGKKGIVVEDGAKLTIEGISETRSAERGGSLDVVATEGSAIGGKFITINNLATLTAKAGDVNCAYGIGAIDAEVTINNTKIDYVSGAFVQPLFKNDEKYGKSEPEGASAIGGKTVVLNGVELVKAEGGSKAAAIGNRYWQDTEVVIKNSQFGDIFGGNASAAIGGSRYNGESKHNVKILIENSTIANAVGGQFGAGIGSGYDTHCNQQDYTTATNEIVIKASTINAKGGKYAAGIGTGFHSAYLTGSIDAESTINSTAGNETFYKDTYTLAQNLGYGVMDPAREFSGANTNVTFTVAGKVISTPTLGVAEGVGVNEEDEYLVTATEGLEYIAEQVNTGNKEYTEAKIVLDGDIDLAQLAAMTRSSAVANNWTPIGTEANPFKGSFDGKGKTIKNLALVESEAKEGKAFIGFFGYAKDATIKNVTFENVYINIPCLDIDHSQGHIGAVAGSLEGTSTIENVTVKGDVKVYSTQDANGASRVAVIAGGNSYGNVTMKNVHVIANEGSYLIANNNTGALAGQLQGKSVFEDCSSNINVTVNKFFAGGIIGLAAGDQTFINCHTTGNIAVVAGREGRAHDQYRVGGIAGGWSDGAKNVCTLTNCSYTGEVSGKNSDGSVANPLDYMGYVGRGYTLNGCQGSKVIIDGMEFVQKHNTASEAGIYDIANLEISSKADMFWFAQMVNSNKCTFAGQTVKLAADIDLNNENWTPIGSASIDHGFMGNFDGNGYVIKNLAINEITADADGYVYAGLFGITEGTDKDNQNYIKNLVIENVNIATEGHIVAAAIASPYYTELENIKVQGNVNIKGGNYTAGVLAYTRRLVDAENISIEANAGSSIEGNMTVGGVISDIQMNGGLKANYSNFKAEGLTIKGNKCVGGISGIIGAQTLDGATVKNVDIVSDDYRKGTLAGSFDGVSEIKNAVVENVTGADNFIGGLYEGTASESASITINNVTYTYNNGWLVDGYKVLADGLLKKDNEYKVTNANGLVALSGMTIKGNEVVTLGANIDLTGVTFTGLSAFNSEQNNTFDGKGFTVSNWTNNLGASDMGFFKSWVGTIKNVKFENCHLKTAGRSAIVAANTYCNIENVEVKNSSIEDSYWACGIIAGLYNAGNISNCVVTDSSVKSNGGTAAIVGVINETAGVRNVTNCSVTGCTINNTGVYGENYSGGALVGKFNCNNTTYTIEGCTVSNNTLVGDHVYEKYPANENVIEK